MADATVFGIANYKYCSECKNILSKNATAKGYTTCRLHKPKKWKLCGYRYSNGRRCNEPDHNYHVHCGSCEYTYCEMCGCCHYCDGGC